MGLAQNPKSQILNLQICQVLLSAGMSTPALRWIASKGVPRLVLQGILKLGCRVSRVYMRFRASGFRTCIGLLHLLWLGGCFFICSCEDA